MTSIDTLKTSSQQHPPVFKGYCKMPMSLRGSPLPTTTSAIRHTEDRDPPWRTWPTTPWCSRCYMKSHKSWKTTQTLWRPVPKLDCKLDPLLGWMTLQSPSWRLQPSSWMKPQPPPWWRSTRSFERTVYGWITAMERQRQYCSIVELVHQHFAKSALSNSWGVCPFHNMGRSEQFRSINTLALHSRKQSHWNTKYKQGWTRQPRHIECYGGSSSAIGDSPFEQGCCCSTR